MNKDHHKTSKAPSEYLIKFYAENHTKEDMEKLLRERRVEGAKRQLCLDIFDKFREIGLESREGVHE